MDKQPFYDEWLITVSGHDYCYSPPNETITIKKKFKRGKTPIDWFLSGPKIYSRFSFTPTVLINFWKI